MRGKKALLNSVASLTLDIVSVICGFIVPRLIIGTYGSQINALTSSITQFLGYIALVQAGVSGVVRASLYKPLAENDIQSVSSIVKSTENFFRKIAYIFAGYMFVLACLYPLLVNNKFGWFYTASLLIIIGLSSFAQYYFGLTYYVLVHADQRRYIATFLDVLTIILNAVIVVIMAKSNASIHSLKFFSALIYILRPIVLNLYVKKKYKLIKNVKPKDEALSQKWDGFGHHIATFVANNTDITLLTVYSKISKSFDIAEISVYAVYYTVVNGVMKFAQSISSGMEAAMGNMIANKEKDCLIKRFNLYELLSFFVVTILFSSAAILIVPFVSVYLKGVDDANYIRPLFGYTLVAAYGAYSLRFPYNNIIFAAGHYKQTKKGAYMEAIINIVVSVALVPFFGIVGVAIGTLVAMTFRTVQYVFYLSKNIINRSVGYFFKRLSVSASCVILSFIVMNIVPSPFVKTYFDWAIYAVETTVFVIIISIIMNVLFDRKSFFELIKLSKSILTNKK